MVLLDDIMANIIYIQAAMIIIVSVFLERFISRYIKRVARRNEWPPHVINGLAFTFRLLILLGAIATFLSVGGVPPEWLLSFTALGGAAIGFAFYPNHWKLCRWALRVHNSSVSC